MRVHSTYEIDANQQPNPFKTQSAGVASTGKTSTELSFQDHLNTYLQQAQAQTITRCAESQVAGIFMGFHPALRVQQKLDPTLKEIAT